MSAPPGLDSQPTSSAETHGRRAPDPLHVTFALRAFPVTSETFILRQITGLMDLGHSVHILAEWRPKDEVAHAAVRAYGLAERVTYVHEARPRPAATVGRMLRKLTGRSPRCLGLLLRDRAAPYGGRRAVFNRLSALLASTRTDVLHSHFGDIGLRYAEPAHCLGIPHVVSFYGYDCSRFPRERGENAYAPLFRRVDRVTVLSDRMRDRLVQLGCPSTTIRKLHLGVDPSEYTYRERSLSPADEPLRVLTVARLVEKKGLEYGLRAVAKVLATRRGDARAVRYDIIGDGPLRGMLEALAAELDLDGRVHFHGSQDQKVVRRAMLDAHVFLLPSVTAADGDEEGTPTVLLEASSTGLPVISTWHSGIPETVLDGETGLLVPERNVDALAERLESLLDDPELWVSMARNGRRHVEAEFDIRVLSRELAEHYREVAETSANS